MSLIMNAKNALTLPGRSWKQMVSTAEAMLVPPAFALVTEPSLYELQACVAGGFELAATIEGQILTVVGKSRQRFVGGRMFGYVSERPVRASFTLPPDAADAGMTTRTAGDVLFVKIPRSACIEVEATASAGA